MDYQLKIATSDVESVALLKRLFSSTCWNYENWRDCFTLHWFLLQVGKFEHQNKKLCSYFFKLSLLCSCLSVLAFSSWFSRSVTALLPEALTLLSFTCLICHLAPIPDFFSLLFLPTNSAPPVSISTVPAVFSCAESSMFVELSSHYVLVSLPVFKLPTISSKSTGTVRPFLLFEL